jgi:bifunctional enzyme CysN/CysC
VPVEKTPEGRAVAGAGVAGLEDARAADSPLRVLVCGGSGHGKTTVLECLECASDKAAPAHARPDATRRNTVLEELRPGAAGTADLVTSAKTAHTAVVVVDAQGELTPDARRQIWLAALIGIGDIVVVINKMDLVGYEKAQFRALEQQSRAFCKNLAATRFAAIPTAAMCGGNVARPSEAMPWYQGPTLAEHLEASESGRGALLRPFRMVVEHADEIAPDRTECAGRVTSGVVKAGDAIVVFPSRCRSTVEQVITAGASAGELAVASEYATLTLADTIPAKPGDLIAAADAQPGLADQFQATVVWTGAQPMLRGRSYRLQGHGTEVIATIAPLKYKLQIDSPEHVAATTLERDEVGVCELELGDPIAFDPFDQNRETGSFTLLDRLTGSQVGFGVIHFALRRSHNVRWQAVNVNKRARALSMGQQPTVLWLTGLSGSGKSTVANLVESELQRRGHNTYMLDGDNVRHGLNADLGFTEQDRVENIRRVSEVAQLMVDAGLIVIVSFISPFRAERHSARSLFAEEEFIEIFVDTPLEVAEGRDTKGLYKKARSGQLVNFTGIDSPYEPPEAPEVHLKTTELTPEAGAAKVIKVLEDSGRLRPPPAE